MQAAIDQVKGLAATVSHGARRQLIASLRNVASSLEDPEDTLDRCSRLHLEAAIITVGLEMGIFKQLASSTAPMTVAELSRQAGAEPQLLTRIMRYLAAIGSVDEVSQGRFGANSVTNNLSTAVVVAGMFHSFHTIGPQYQALPSFLKRTGYKEPQDDLHTAFQDGWNTSLDAFTWFADNPDHLAYFNDFMALRRKPALSWLSVYPVREVAGSCSPDQAVYVNIGGGIGHQCVEFKQKFPDVSGRVILQDLPHTIANALACQGVEHMAYDFYEPQPIKGAKLYFMRGVLHDHPARLVEKILYNTRIAMSEDSVLLVDEMILPEMGTEPPVAAIDLTMLTSRGGMERTEAQWQHTFEVAGLELHRTYVYNPANHESVMEVRLPRLPTP
ncbi:S-adenosyl-L-methionine-dependent methyltransferase [Hypoxylon argillaceum]|nr:S-adenosyl-L-methionine-dependent methyltransferase [Hypoxylon argillaceum]